MSRFREDGPAADWLGFEEAVDRILESVEPLPTEEIPLEEAAGRVTAGDLTAHRTLPPWPNSAMDGFAVRGSDLEGVTDDRPNALRVVGDSRPGAPWPGSLGPGEAVRIMTGGPIPDGADTVVRVEHTDAASDGAIVRIHSDADRFRHIRPEGEDMSPGDVVLPAGSWIGAGQTAILSGLGVDRLVVRRRPRVAILSTGDELQTVRPGFDAWDRGVPDTNSPTLARAIENAGAVALPMGIARDSSDSLEEALARIQEASPDVLLTTGGASMGAADLVKPALARAGYESDFWRVKIRPGSPFSFGRLPGPIHVFGLPGNPVSSFVTFQLLARPFVLALGGQDRRFCPVVRATAGEALTGARELAIFLRVRLDPAAPRGSEGVGPAYVAHLTGPQGSGLMNSLGIADGLAVLPRGVERIETGEPVSVVLLGGGPRGVPRVPLDP
jgi:molybdopterin molybdotransferase